MGKAMTVTDSKTLWGEDPDKKKNMFFFHLFELLAFQSPTCIHNFYIFLFEQ